MKRFLPTALFVLVLNTPAAFAQFTAITDTFSTAAGLTGTTPNSGVGNWTTIGGSAGLAVASGTLTIAGVGGEASQLNFSSGNITSGTIYMGFSYTVSSSGSISTSDSISAIAGFRVGLAGSGSYAVGLGDFRPSTAAQTFSGVPGTSTSQVALGIFTGSSLNATSSTLTAWPTPINRGTTYRLVLGFDLTNNTATLWLNPTSTSSTSVTLSAVSSDARGVFFREGAATHGNISILNLSVSTNFSTAAAIPEPSTYAAIFGSAALVAAGWHRRRQKRNAPPPV